MNQCFSIKILMIFVELFIISSGFSQVATSSKLNDPFQNAVILSHYSTTDLAAIQVSDTVKFNTIEYYYTQSFLLETIACSNCIAFDASKFDVSTYERFRKKSERYTRAYDKYGFKLTLLSIDELTYKLPIHNQ
jgi:hypothetical protein